MVYIIRSKEMDCIYCGKSFAFKKYLWVGCWIKKVYSLVCPHCYYRIDKKGNKSMTEI
jgi:hypothetical protein